MNLACICGAHKLQTDSYAVRDWIPKSIFSPHFLIAGQCFCEVFWNISCFGVIRKWQSCGCPMCSFHGCCSPCLAESFSFLHSTAADFSELRVSFWPGQVNVAVIQVITLCGCVSWVPGLFQRSVSPSAALHLFIICCRITAQLGVTLQGCKNSKLPLLPLGPDKIMMGFNPEK